MVNTVNNMSFMCPYCKQHKCDGQYCKQRKFDGQYCTQRKFNVSIL